MELMSRQIPWQHELELAIYYKGKQLQTGYRADFVCYESIIVELKAVSQLTSAHEAQLINYLKATGLQVGLLLNFGSESLEYKRLVLSKHRRGAE
jgi:GxxExxY protein